MTDWTNAQAERMAELLTAFKLPTVNAELVSRLTSAGLTDALGVVLEVLEAEHDDRKQRRVERLLRASKLPPGKTLEAYRIALNALQAERAGERVATLVVIGGGS